MRKRCEVLNNPYIIDYKKDTDKNIIGEMVIAMERDSQEFKAKILVGEIPPEGLSLYFEDMPGLLRGLDDCWSKGPIKGEVFIFRSGKKVEINGKVEAGLELLCHRCLTHYDSKVCAEFHYTFLEPPVWKKDEEIHLSPEDIEVSYYDGEEIELSDIFREQILLQLPMRQLCKEDCKGICPGCGADLNKEPCRCQETPVEGPFAILRKIKIS